MSSGEEHDLDEISEVRHEYQKARVAESLIPATYETGSAIDMQRAQKETQEKTTTIPVKANLTGSEPPSILFRILKSDVEEHGGIKMETSKLYEIKGKVESVYDFEIFRIVIDYVRLYVPVEYHDRIQVGKVYNIRITLIKEVPLTEAQHEFLGWAKRGVPWQRIIYRINHMKADPLNQRQEVIHLEKPGSKSFELSLGEREKIEQIGATFTLQAMRHSVKDSTSYFRIHNALFQDKVGINIEEAGNYLIKGRISGVGGFQKTLRSCAAGQGIPIIVPKGLRGKVGVGKEYEIVIDSIEKLPSFRDSWQEGEPIETDDWTWRDLGRWIDTEGCIFCPENGGGYRSLSQKDRKVLREIAGFLDKNGVHSKLRLDKDTGVYYLIIQGADQMAKVIKNTEPFVRTANRKLQIEQFKEKLKRPRKTLQRSIRIAREILDLK